MQWIGKLLSLPFLWLGQLTGMLKLPLSVPLLRTAWLLGGDGQVARTTLLAIHHRDGLHAARVQAARWMETSPRAEIAVFAGLMALGAGEVELAEGFLARGQGMGKDRDGLLELLEFGLAGQCGATGSATQLARRMEQQRDLPPVVSRVILNQLLWDAMLDGRHDEARRRAEHLLEVEDMPQAEMALWALAKLHGDQRRADKHLQRAKLASPQKVYFQVLGNLAIRAHADARELLSQLHSLDATLARNAEDFLQGKESLA